MTTCTSRAAWVHLLRRLHFFIGLFVGPFIFVAALTGTLYVATPQLENLMYRQALQGEMSGERHSLAEQIAVAERALGTPLRLSAVRPALEAGETTRVMFDDPALAPSENRAIFIDPITLAVKGDMTVYGTSGILPLPLPGQNAALKIACRIPAAFTLRLAGACLLACCCFRRPA